MSQLTGWYNLNMKMTAKQIIRLRKSCYMWNDGCYAINNICNSFWMCKDSLFPTVDTKHQANLITLEKHSICLLSVNPMCKFGEFE